MLNGQQYCLSIVGWSERIKPFMDILTLVYVLLYLLWQEFMMTSLINGTWLLQSYTDLFKWMRRIGLLLVIGDFLIGKGWKKGARAYCLYAICLIDAIASYTMRKYGYLKSLDQIKFEIITITLFYCVPQRCERSKICVVSRMIYWILLLVWSVFACLSLCQFALLIGEGGIRDALVPFLGGKGVFGNRLYGVFTYPEYGAVGSLLMMLAGGFYFTTTPRKWERFLMVIWLFPLLIYMVLSGSRNAQLAFYVCIFIGSGFAFQQRMSIPTGKIWRQLATFLIALCITLTAHIGWQGIDTIAPKIPALLSGYSGTLAAKHIDQESVPVEQADLIPEQQEEQNQLQEQIEQSDPGAAQAAESAAKVLERNDTKKGDISNNRFQLWKDYLSLWKEIGLIGLSSANSGYYIQEHHPEMFICYYIRETSPDDYARGTVYHPHNGYLKTLVSTGFLGLFLLIAFLLGNAKEVLTAFHKKTGIQTKLMFLLLVVLGGCSAAMFDWELFFVFNLISGVWWLALGGLMAGIRAERI